MLINGSISANIIKLRSYPACEQSGHHSVRSIQIYPGGSYLNTGGNE